MDKVKESFILGVTPPSKTFKLVGTTDDITYRETSSFRFESHSCSTSTACSHIPILLAHV
jgi:hypothetical protein